MGKLSWIIQGNREGPWKWKGVGGGRFGVGEGVTMEEEVEVMSLLALTMAEVGGGEDKESR